MQCHDLIRMYMIYQSLRYVLVSYQYSIHPWNGFSIFRWMFISNSKPQESNARSRTLAWVWLVVEMLYPYKFSFLWGTSLLPSAIECTRPSVCLLIVSPLLRGKRLRVSLLLIRIHQAIVPTLSTLASVQVHAFYCLHSEGSSRKGSAVNAWDLSLKPSR